MPGLLDDLRYGARLLSRSPAFTGVALVTLALGIGLNSAIFSVIRSILLCPLPYREAARVVAIDEIHPQLHIEDPGVSAVNFLDWRARNHVFDEMVVYNATGLNLTGAGEPERLDAAVVSAGMFPLLGVWPAHGRAFGPEENHPGQARGVLVSWRLWQRRFGGSLGALGRTVVLNGRAYSLAGVMPAGFRFPTANTDAWLPIEPDPRQRGQYGAEALARLKPGVSLRQAAVELDAIEQNMAAQYPEVAGWHVKLTPWLDRVAGEARTPLLVLMGAVAFVLLIACANVANLLLARAPARRREIAVRAALGAGRGRIVRQLLAESVLLSAAGGLLGLLVGRLCLALLVARVSSGIPRMEEIRMDG